MQYTKQKITPSMKTTAQDAITRPTIFIIKITESNIECM